MPKFSWENDYVFVPIYGKYRWFIVLMAFSNTFIGDGVLFSFGVFLRPLSIHYRKTIATISIVHGLLVGTYLLCRPIIFALINRFGYQIISLLGGIMCVLGYGLPSFFPIYPVLVLGNGILAGIGTGTIFCTSTIVVNIYFGSDRGIANSLAQTGTSFGTAFMPLALSTLMRNYGLTATYYIIALMMIIPTVFALFYFPLTPVRILTDISFDVAVIQQGLLDTVNRGKQKPKKIKISYKFYCCKFDYPIVNSSFPTISQLVSEERRNVPNLGYFIDEAEVPLSFLKKKTWIYFLENLTFFKFFREGTIMRPLYRDDIFYSGNIDELDIYEQTFLQPANMIEDLSYHMAVTRATERNEHNTGSSEKIHRYKAFVRPLRTMLDISLAKYPSFFICMTCSFTLYVGFSIPLTYIYDRAKENGFHRHICAWLIATIGIGWIVGKTCSIGITTIKCINVKFYFSLLLLIGGVITIFSGTAYMIATMKQFMYSFSVGFCCSTMSFYRTVLIEYYGLENLTNTYGLSQVFMGFGSLIGLVVAGFIKEWFNNYDYVFYLAGGCLLTSSFCMFFLGIFGLIMTKRKVGL